MSAPPKSAPKDKLNSVTWGKSVFRVTQNNNILRGGSAAICAYCT